MNKIKLLVLLMVVLVGCQSSYDRQMAHLQREYDSFQIEQIKLQGKKKLTKDDFRHYQLNYDRMQMILEDQAYLTIYGK